MASITVYVCLHRRLHQVRQEDKKREVQNNIPDNRKGPICPAHMVLVRNEKRIQDYINRQYAPR
jgi:hypothetical protein